MNKKDVLKNLVEIDSGYAFKSSFFNYNFEGIPIIRIRDINSGIAETYYSGDYEEKFIVNNDDLLIGMDGNFKIRKWSGGKALLNQRVCRIKSISNKLSNEYLYRILPLELKLIEDKTSFVTVKHLSVKDINNIELIIPDIDIQNKIVKIIDKSQELIDNRKKQIEELDLLVKSKFIEMFGDPIKNQKNFPLMTVDDVIEFQGGSQPDKKYFEYKKTDDNIRLIQIRDYKTDAYVTYIPKSMSKRYCSADDIMIGRYGPPIFQILKGIEGSYNVALLKAMPKMGNKEFIREFLKQECLFTYLDGLSQRTAGQSGIDMPKLKAYPFPYPPIKLQNEFEKFIKQVDKLKFEMEKSLKELEDNFNSLMQKAFKGELFK
ncbi:TPA: restriction endonuclease subunit S [Clostridium perfringens]|nr:restriction endonuclease subunit S [Clostridium perfringens]